MAQLPVNGPFDERHTHADPGTDPVRANPGKPFRLREGRLWNLQRVETTTEIEEHLGVEPRSDLPGEDEIVALEHPDEQRAEAHAPALRIGEAADHQLRRRLAFHLQPE